MSGSSRAAKGVVGVGSEIIIFLFKWGEMDEPLCREYAIRDDLPWQRRYKTQHHPTNSQVYNYCIFCRIVCNLVQVCRAPLEILAKTRTILGRCLDYHCQPARRCLRLL